MNRVRREQVATVLVSPHAVADLELELMARDLYAWPIATAPNCMDGPRRAFQVRRSLLMKHQGDWDVAADWVPVWVSFGPTWHDGDEPLPWAAHAALWEILNRRAGQVRFHRRLAGVPRLSLPQEAAL